MNDFKEFFSILLGVEGKIDYCVRESVVFLNLVSGWGKKRQDYFVLRIERRKSFNYRSALFELSQGGTVKPQREIPLFNGVFKSFESTFSSGQKQADFFIEKSQKTKCGPE